MKNNQLITLALIFCALTMRPQLAQYQPLEPPAAPREMYFDLHPAYSREIKKSALNGVKLLRDLMQGYPVNWISRYKSVEISCTRNGKTQIVRSTQEELNKEQLAMLAGAEPGSQLKLNVHYVYDNPGTRQQEDNKILVEATVAPDEPAVYSTGDEALKRYMKESCVDKIPADISRKLYVTLKFIVGEDGRVQNASVKKSSGDAANDRSLLETLQRMPAWSPATLKNGTKVKQEFVLIIAREMPGC